MPTIKYNIYPTFADKENIYKIVVIKTDAYITYSCFCKHQLVKRPEVKLQEGGMKIYRGVRRYTLVPGTTLWIWKFLEVIL